MLAPLLMVPAPCPLHLRPGGGALPALRPGEPPPRRAGPTATRRCGRQRGRGAARAGRGGETRTLAAPGPEGQEETAVLKGFPAPAMFRRAAQSPAWQPTPSPSTSPSSGSLRAEPLRDMRGAPSVEGTAHTRCRPPGAGSSAAATPRKLRPGLQPRPTCSAPPRTVPRRAPPSSQHVMTQDVVTPNTSSSQRFWEWGGVCPVPVFHPRSGCEATLCLGKFLVPRHQDLPGKELSSS